MGQIQNLDQSGDEADTPQDTPQKKKKKRKRKKKNKGNGDANNGNNNTNTNANVNNDSATKSNANDVVISANGSPKCASSALSKTDGNDAAVQEVTKKMESVTVSESKEEEKKEEKKKIAPPRPSQKSHPNNKK